MAFDANSTPAPSEHPALARHRFRQRLTIAIDRLIVALDEIDGDPDLEPYVDDEEETDDDQVDGEPSLCGVFVGPGTPGIGSLGEITFDLEDQCEDEGHDSDREPSFGGVEMAPHPADEDAEASTAETAEHGQ